MLTDAFDSLAKRRILLFGGKGGVGKTTIASLAALHFSQTRKVILFTTDPASNLSDLFGDPATRQPGNLKIEELDAQDLYRKFLDENLPFLLEIGDRGTYLDREELRRFFELSLPGVDELMAWMHIGELAGQNEDALLVVDTAPTGHTLRMLGAGEHFRQFAEALDTLEAKHRSLVRQFTRRDVRDAIDDYIVRFEEQARRRRELLTNREITSFIPVFLSEPWVVEQTLRLAADVRADGIDVVLAILNRAVLDPDCEQDRERQKAGCRGARAGCAHPRDRSRALVRSSRFGRLIAPVSQVEDRRLRLSGSTKLVQSGQARRLSSTCLIPSSSFSPARAASARRPAPRRSRCSSRRSIPTNATPSSPSIRRTRCATYSLRKRRRRICRWRSLTRARNGAGSARHSAMRSSAPSTLSRPEISLSPTTPRR